MLPLGLVQKINNNQVQRSVTDLNPLQPYFDLNQFDRSLVYLNNFLIKVKQKLLKNYTAGVDTGHFIIPAISSATVAQGLLFATANDFPTRDPITVTLEGSNNTNIAMLHQASSWTLIYTGPTGIKATADPGRNIYVSPRNFSNTTPYASYRLLITAQRGPANSVQYAEAHIIGYVY